MDLRRLRYFVTVARERNFTRAAELLNMAQPPLSRQIQLLEEELGVLLIQRDTRPVKLTAAGRLLHEQATQMLGQVEQMQAATRRVGLNQRSVLFIGFVASVLYGGLPTLIRKLRQHSSGVDIQLVELMSVQQVQALREGRIDIGFGRIRHNDAQLASIVLREERLAVAMPMNCPLATTDQALPLHALAGQKLIVYPKEPRPGYADQVMGLLHSHDVRAGEVQEVREIQTALGLVAAESGLCVIPSSARQLRQDVHYRMIESERATSPVVFSHRLNDDSSYINIIKNLIAETFSENPPWLDAKHNLPDSIAFKQH